MIVSTEQQKIIFAELDRIIELECEPEPEEFTIQEYARHAERSDEWARKKLDELAERGTIQCRIYKGKKYYRLMDERNQARV